MDLYSHHYSSAQQMHGTGSLNTSSLMSQLGLHCGDVASMNLEGVSEYLITQALSEQLQQHPPDFIMFNSDDKKPTTTIPDTGKTKPTPDHSIPLSLLFK